MRSQVRAQAEGLLRTAAPTSAPGAAAAGALVAIARLDLGKAWHGVHWLVCGAPEPDGSAAGGAVLGGVEVGQDLGYGAARLLDPAAVARIATALSVLDEATLQARYDGAAMAGAGLYPGGFDDPSNWREELVSHALAVRDLYAKAASNGQAVLAYLT